MVERDRETLYFIPSIIENNKHTEIGIRNASIRNTYSFTIVKVRM